MSTLDGKITIERKLRPCIVTIKRTERELSGKLHEDTYKFKALFQCWGYRSELYDASPMIGSHPGGQVSETFAIVEYEDGTVHEIEPHNLRFVDNLMNEYAFPEMEEKHNDNLQ